MRDIKTVLRGVISSGEVREWDVTPEVTVVPAAFTNEGIHQATWNDTALHVNGVGNADSIYIGAMKTTLTMADLASGQGLRYGVRISSILVPGALFFGLVILPGTTTASEASQLIVATLTGSPQPPVIFSGILATDTASQSLIGGSIATDLTPSLNLAAASSSANIANMDIDVGYVEHLFLRKYNNDFYIAKEIVSADGTTYDIYAQPVIANNPVVADDMTIFVFAGSVIIGGLTAEHARYSIEPTFAIVPISTDVTATTFAAQVGDQATFDSYFPTLNQPSMISVTQKPFPLGARPLEFYQTKITAPVGVPIAPYGIAVNANQLVLINNVALGSESFTPMLDTISMADFLAPVFTQQTAMVQSIAELGSLVGQSAMDVNRALINAGEMIVYVRDVLNDGGVLASNISYPTLDLAYAYLSSFPRFLHKRIVLDDRAGFIIAGEPDSTYQFGLNNIKLSTYNSYIGKPLYLNPSIYNSGSLGTVIQGYYPNLVLDHFEGRMVPGNAHIVTDNGLCLSLNESFLYAHNDNFDLPAVTTTNYVEIKNHSCFIYSGSLDNVDETQHPSVWVTADETSAFDVDASAFPTVAMVDKLYISRLSSYRADIIPVGLYSSGYVRRDIVNPNTQRTRELNELLWLINLANTDNAVVRHPMDFGDYNYNNGLQYAHARRFIIAGEIDLSATTINTIYPKLTLIGLPGASLTTNGTLVRLINGSALLEISNLTLKSAGLLPMIEATDTSTTGSQSLTIKDCIVDAPNPIAWGVSLITYGPNIFELTRVEFKNTTQSIVITGVTETRIRDITINQDASPAVNAFDVTFKNLPFQSKNTLIIDGVDFKVANTDASGTLPAILNISGTYVPNTATASPGTLTHIDVSAVRTISNHNATTVRDIAVKRNGLPYDYYEDTNFETDQSDSFAFLKGSALSVYSAVNEINYCAPSVTDTQLKNFQLASFGINYTGTRQRRFKVTIRGTSSCSSSIYKLFLQRVKYDSIIGAGTPDTTVLATENITGFAGVNRPFEITRMVTLRSGYAIAMYAQNMDSAAATGLANLVWDIVEV